ncbi:T9SS type A sorting domain-containing protein [Flavobacterium hauense]
MKGKLLLGMFMLTFGAFAQTTHHLNWSMSVSNAQASLTIEQGDIIEWTWTDALPHTVTSIAGGAETFNSGQKTGNGQTFSHTFENAGVTNYKCNVHAMMTGTITVTAVAGINDNDKIGFEYYPNPTTDVVTINAAETIDRIEMYDVNGRQVMNSKSGNPSSKVYMAGYPVGTYYLKVFIANASKDITIVKN